MARPDYCRFLPSKWRASTLALTWEQEGLLIRISAFNMDAGVPLPPCRTTAARMLGAHRNKLDKVLDALIAAGEITEDETGIYSQRAIEEYRRASGEMKGGKKTEKVISKPATNHAETRRIPRRYPGDTPEIPRGYPEDTPNVEAEKSEQILRAKREEKRREEIKEDSPVVPKTFDGYERVRIVDGRLELFNGLKAFWLEKFGNDEARLDLALIEALPNLNANSRTPLEAQVGRLLARVAGDKLDRDRRYASAVAAKATAAKPKRKLSRWADV